MIYHFSKPPNTNIYTQEFKISAQEFEEDTHTRTDNIITPSNFFPSLNECSHVIVIMSDDYYP